MDNKDGRPMMTDCVKTDDHGVESENYRTTCSIRPMIHHKVDFKTEDEGTLFSTQSLMCTPVFVLQTTQLTHFSTKTVYNSKVNRTRKCIPATYQVSCRL
jgi:hypothetical protein